MTILVDTILKLNPKADFSIKENDINQITWLNGTTPISLADIQAQIPIVEQEIANAEATRLAKKESAKAKLAALGLDEEEIKAIIGV